jgi:hypothetical protein
MEKEYALFVLAFRDSISRMVHQLADIVGAGVAASIAPGSGIDAEWVQLLAGGTGTVRIGDSSTGAASGLPVPTGAAMMYPYKGMGNFYPLSGLFAYVPVGATLYVLYDA